MLMHDTSVIEATSEGFAVSPQQKRIWRLSRNTRNNPFCASCLARVEGALDLDRLRAAAARVVSENEILRTVFYKLPEAPDPLQVVLEHGATPDAFFRIEDRAPDEPSQDWRGDLGRDLPIRFTVASMGVNDWSIEVSASALCADSATLFNIVGELAAAYAEPRGENGDEEPIQYIEIADWMNETLTAEASAAGLAHWRNIPLTAALTAVGDTARDFRPGRIERDLAQTLSSRIDAARVGGDDGYALMLAAWFALLGRLTGESSLIVGAGASGRPFEDLDKATGLFAKHLPLDIDYQPKSSFAELREMVEQTRQTGLEWQSCFSWEREDGDAHFLPYLFDFCRTPEAIQSAGLNWTVTRGHVCLELFEKRLSVTRRNGTWSIALHYDRETCSEREASRIFDQYLTLLSSALATPTRRLDALEILDPEQYHELLTTFNQTASEYPANRCMHELFEDQVKQTPAATAVIMAGPSGREHEPRETLRYIDLDRRANCLAHRLRALGVGPETTVGLCVARSTELLIGILGIHKAGGAYLPLDLNYPRERLAWMLDDGAPKVLLTTSGLRDRLPEFEGPVVSLDDGPLERSGPESERPPVNGANAGHAAYLIYTSGSTGRPKGVMVPHRAIINRLWWMRDRFPLQTEDRVLHRTSYSFDASIWELFLPLFSGARVVIAAQTEHHDGEYLLNLIAELGVTVAQFPPSLLATLLDGDGLSRCHDLKRVFCGGEVLAPALVERFYQKTSDPERVSLHNLYGPTEASIDVCSWPCPRGATEVPIGKPLPNTRLYILDANLQPVPIGAAGELYIHGAGLARGYRNRPDLTADRFRPDPLTGAPGERRYRTGDFAKWRDDGAVLYLGRKDDQVKIRGFRIELGEIEAVLRAEAAVRDAVVICDERMGEGLINDRRILAYVIPRESMHFDVSSLQTWIADRLPAYMAPAAIIEIDALPLTPNGKLDRRALPAPDFSGKREARDERPATPTEELLTGLWAEILDLESVGVHENFFELGGHSLLSTQIISRIRRQFSIEFSVRSFFQYPTIQTMAAEIDKVRNNRDGQAWGPIQPVARDQPLPLSFAQQRLWFTDQLEGPSAHYNLPLALRLRGRLDVAAMKRALTEIIRRHEALRTHFELRDDEPVQVIGPEPVDPIQVHEIAGDLSEQEQTAQVETLIEADATRPFDLAAGPPVRIDLLRCSEQEHILRINMHHIVSDAWSIGILTREIAALYAYYQNGGTGAYPLRPLKIQYADFAHGQRDRLNQSILDKQLDYWRGRLAGAPETTRFKTDYPRPEHMTAVRGRIRFHALPSELSAGMTRLCRREGVTLFMAAFASFGVLVRHETQQDDLVIGTDVANRNRSEIEDLIGFFINQLVLRLDMSGNPSFRDLLGQTREAALSAYDHQDLPFESLVASLLTQRNRAHSPFFQINFLMDNVPRSRFMLPDLEIEQINTLNETANLDISMNLIEDNGKHAFACRYNADLYTSATVDRWFTCLQSLFEAVVADPGLDLNALDAVLKQAVASHDAKREAVFEAARNTKLKARFKAFNKSQV